MINDVVFFRIRHLQTRQFLVVFGTTSVLYVPLGVLGPPVVFPQCIIRAGVVLVFVRTFLPDESRAFLSGTNLEAYVLVFGRGSILFQQLCEIVSIFFRFLIASIYSYKLLSC